MCSVSPCFTSIVVRCLFGKNARMVRANGVDGLSPRAFRCSLGWSTWSSSSCSLASSSCSFTVSSRYSVRYMGGGWSKVANVPFSAWMLHLVKRITSLTFCSSLRSEVISSKSNDMTTPPSPPPIARDGSSPVRRAGLLGLGLVLQAVHREFVEYWMSHGRARETPLRVTFPGRSRSTRSEYYDQEDVFAPNDASYDMFKWHRSR